MSSSDFSDLPNPFAMAQGQTRRSKRGWWANGQARYQRFLPAAKYLLVVLLCFSAFLGVRHLCGQWVLHRLTHDFASLSGDEKRQRLIQMEGLGAPAIPNLVDALLDEETQTARTAYEVLLHCQNQWTVLRESRKHQRHASLVAAIDGIAGRLPDDRTGWATNLIQQSIKESVGRKTSDAVAVYQSANQAIDRLTLATREKPVSIVPSLVRSSGSLATSTRDSQQQRVQPGDQVSLPSRFYAQAQPLPVDSPGVPSGWTDWPPAAPTNAGGMVSITSLPGQPNVSPSQPPQQASVYRSGASVRLRPALSAAESSRAEEASLRDYRKANEDARTSTTELLAESPLSSYTDRSVMQWLISESSVLRENAQLELLSRGYTQPEIDIATEMANPDASVRLQLIDRLVHQSNIDPRPWLWKMTQDPSRDVRMQVVNVFASMNDTQSRERLRTLMSQERDPLVIAQIERALDSRLR